MNEVEFEPDQWFDLKDELQDKHLISVSVDYTGRLFLLTTVENVEYRGKYGGFPKLKTETPHNYLVLEATESYTIAHHIPEQYWNYHRVQPLPDDELLLVCGRSEYRGKDDYDLNARVFTLDGKPQREFLLGDGIEDIQTTKSGEIWTSYFDEGVLGNYGWRDPIGQHGLVKWDKHGDKLYEFQPRYELNRMIDCYAINVESDKATWVYYRPDFPLVCIYENRIKDYWRSPVRGSLHFAVWRNFVLFCGDYDEKNRYHLYKLGNNHQMEHVATYTIKDGAAFDVVAGRQGTVTLIHENAFYRITIPELLERK